MDRILSYLAEHPELVVLVGWPVATALASLAQGALERRSPRVASALRASGLDLPGLMRALWPRRLRPPEGPQR